MFYLLSHKPIEVPSYVRLGKFMSRARVVSQKVEFSVEEMEDVAVPFLLNPTDFGPKTELHAYDLITVPPAPLVRNALLSGRFYRLDDGIVLPVGMLFGVEGLPE